MKRMMSILAVFAVLLSACQTVPVEEIHESDDVHVIETEEPEPAAEQSVPEPGPEYDRPSFPTSEDYIEMLYALQHAFATGEFEAFVESYPGVVGEGWGAVGPAINEWPTLLEGVTSKMSFCTEDFADRNWSTHSRTWCNVVTVQLYVSNGNRYLPSGKQTLELGIGLNWGSNTPSIWRMKLTTDGRGSPGTTHFESQILSLVTRLTWLGWTPLEATIMFLDVFEGEGRDNQGFTYDEIVVGAKKYLGIENFSMAGLYTWSDWNDENMPEGIFWERVERLNNGRYLILGIGFDAPSKSMLILDTPSQGNITVRVFTYANHFMLAVDHITDFNLLILHDDDGTPYAQLLSDQPVPWA
ncbi:MAG: hypothetical protein FWE19_03865 [Oscillospiraceae bacterium]|nr:hypothetical protein [Oscillospiraceae bacterium]